MKLSEALLKSSSLTVIVDAVENNGPVRTVTVLQYDPSKNRILLQEGNNEPFMSNDNDWRVIKIL